MTSGLYILRQTINQYLSYSLENAIKEQLIKDWLSNKTFIGIEHFKPIIDSKNNKMNEHPSFDKIADQYVSKFSQAYISTTLGSIGNFFSFISSLYHVKNISHSINTSIFVSIYAFITGAIGFKLSQSKATINKQNMLIDQDCLTNLVHIEHNKDSISSIGYEPYEFNKIKKQLNTKKKSFNKIFKSELTTIF
ncbi:MAG: hypothetical protein ACK4OM_07000 [Alphaproteobacteria bacterium]